MIRKDREYSDSTIINYEFGEPKIFTYWDLLLMKGFAMEYVVDWDQEDGWDQHNEQEGQQIQHS